MPHLNGPYKNSSKPSRRKLCSSISRAGQAAGDFRATVRESRSRSGACLHDSGHFRRNARLPARASAGGDNGRYSITVQGFDEVETHSIIPAPSDVELLEPAKQQVA